MYSLDAHGSGAVVVLEDLATHTQHHLLRHLEEVSALALTADGRILASVSGPAHVSRF